MAMPSHSRMLSLTLQIESSFDKDDAPKETIPSIITSMGKGGTKNVLQEAKEDILKQHLLKEESK